jgi:hypothetical protein
MHALTSDAHLHHHLSQAGLHRASQFSWAQTGQATVDLLRSFL